MESDQYVRTQSNDDGVGHRYETKMTALTALRLYRNCDEFSVASNLARGDKFDDIVFTSKTNGVPYTCLMQLKHKQVSTLETKKISLSALRTKDDFNLVKYYNSYVNIMGKFSSGTNDVIFGQPPSSVKFLLYTNARLAYNKDGIQTTKILLSSGGDAEQNYIFSKESLADVFPVKMDCVQNGSLDDFLSRFCFCTGQANEDDLDGLIQQEIELISKDLSKMDVKYVAHELQTYIFYECMKSGFYLTKDRLQGILSRTEIETGFGRKNECSLEYLPSYIKFVTNQFTAPLTSLKSKAENAMMCKTFLAQAGLSKEPNMLVPLQQLGKEATQDHILKEWGEKSGISLVIDCEGDILNIDKEAVTTFLKKLVNSTGKNKIFLVTALNNAIAFDIGTLAKARNLTFNCTLANLTSQSQRMLREKEVDFQGYRTKLMSLMPQGQERILDDVFDMSSMTQLLQGRSVKVGVKPVASIPYYVTRVLIRKKTVVDTFFTDPTVKAQFALSGITFEEAITKYSASNVALWSACAAETGNVNQRIIILEDDPSANFDSLSTRVRGDLHWFEAKRAARGQKAWQWVASKRGGRMSAVNEHVKTDVEYVPTDNIMTVKEKLVVITAEPGMGKSTLLQHLAAETKKLTPQMWVICLPMNDFTDHFDRSDFIRNIDASTKNLIAQAAGVDKETSKFDARLFNQCYDVTGNMIVLLDGFDEITPYYTKEALSFINALRRSKVCRVWVSARPQWRDMLEENLTTISFTIKAFSPKDQENFLTKFWKHELPEMSDEKLKGIVSKVLDLIEQCFDAKLHQFTGIPLQTRMVAEVFLGALQSYHGTDVLALPERLNGVELFRKFVDKKRGIQMEKAKITVSNASAKWEQRRLNEQREKELMSLALLSLLQRKVCLELDPPVTESRVHELKKLVEDGNEKSGIVLSFRSDQPQFIHRTFAEYFAALFFSKHSSANKKFLGSDEFYEGSFAFVKYFFDRFLCEELKLHSAVLDGDMNSLREELESGANVNVKDQGGRTALHLAAAIPKSEDVIRILLQKGADAKMKDDILEWQPIQLACMIKAPENIAPLLDHSDFSLPKDVMTITWQTLLLAVKGDYITLFHYLLENGIYEVEELDNLSPQTWLDDEVTAGLTILHLAAAYNASEILKYLLNKKSRDSKVRMIEHEDREQRTPLVVAASRGCVNAIRVLMESGANALATSANGKNLLQFAVEAQDKDALSIAVQSAQARNVPAEELLSMPMTTLINERGDRAEWAAKALQLLFSLYPNICNMKTTKAVPLLQAAVHRGNTFVVQLLCTLGAEVNFLTGNGPLLHYAIERGNEEVVEILLNAEGLRINERDSEGNTALNKAIATSQPALVELLVNAGCELGDNDSNSGDILEKAIAAGNEEMVQTLLASPNTDVNALNDEGHTPLYSAILRNVPEIIELMIDAGAKLGPDLNAITEVGPLLHVAVVNGQENVVMEFLSEAGVDVDIKDEDGQTALYKAALTGQPDIFQLLVESGASLKCHTKNGSDLTHAVGVSGNEPIFYYLLESDLKFDKKNNDGQTGLSLLVEGKYWRPAQLLDPTISPTEISGEVIKPTEQAGAESKPPKKKKKNKTSTVEQPGPIETAEPEILSNPAPPTKTKRQKKQPKAAPPPQNIPPLMQQTSNFFDFNEMMSMMKIALPTQETEMLEKMRAKIAALNLTPRAPAQPTKAKRKPKTASNANPQQQQKKKKPNPQVQPNDNNNSNQPKKITGPKQNNQNGAGKNPQPQRPKPKKPAAANQGASQPSTPRPHTGPSANGEKSQGPKPPKQKSQPPAKQSNGEKKPGPAPNTSKPNKAPKAKNPPKKSQ